ALGFVFYVLAFSGNRGIVIPFCILKYDSGLLRDLTTKIF
ncbi:unnamed protein product, partial [marine sediment metagenome]